MRQVMTAGIFTTALMLGIQPMIAHDAAGQPLYAPYPLGVAVPVMAFEHLLVFGFFEAAITALLVRYFQKNLWGVGELKS